MENLNIIGIEKEKAKVLAEKLNKLLANYSVFYMNVRGYHWNIRGEKFFELHMKFEELYNDLIVKIDEVAERILTLGQTPYHSYATILKNATIKPDENVFDGRECVKGILEAFKILISSQRELLDLSADANDEGTNALMSDYIREQEKLSWMYSAFLNK
ncbi:DNA starvation/stationary phase protection protein [Thermaurantimonas aggregans]|uniref:DNA starvation/stationary phase protection protein n=1 Tax=Thermaurantimonas aggregans TaxID=2173829 RepID=A0A401XJK5_9FLAO|nr:Dps family protein [Thermaurantimonas aggregans]MCX8148714.1 DNA starvation/stationary phase protection protein [Thermaurantimonas aggregans]GCD77180.1 DNA starvation/stationary phase protection protein [Thermaurantimonas aggregans]